MTISWQKRKEFAKSIYVDRHSNCMYKTVKYNNVATIHKVSTNSCMSQVTYNNTPIAEAYLFVPQKGANEDFLHWVVNDSFVRCAFKTKDVRDGLDRGFKLDVNVNRAYSNAAMQVLRMLTEFNGKSALWAQLRGMGFSGDECYAICISYDLDQNNLRPCFRNTNHKTIRPFLKMSYYTGEKAKINPEHGTLANPWKKVCHAMTDSVWCVGGRTLTSVKGNFPFTKGNVNIILNKMKENT